MAVKVQNLFYEEMKSEKWLGKFEDEFWKPTDISAKTKREVKPQRAEEEEARYLR